VQAAQTTEFDAIVVGSGISGGWAAKELTEKGLKVLLLERGHNIDHITGYKNATKGPWEYPHRGGRTKQMEADYPVLRRDYPLNEKNLDYWANDKDSPYTEVKRFDWYRGYHLGGRSLMWGRQSYRWSDFDFEANAKDGLAVDWPIRYKDSANITQPLPGRGQCQTRDACWLGCIFGAYFSTQSSTLPAAVKTGNLTLKVNSIVHELVYDKNTKKVSGVRVVDAVTKEATEYKAKIFFLCASTLNSTWLLMRSARDIWPGGLGSSSGELGHNLMDHHFRLGASGRLEGFDDKYYYGRRPTGFYIPRWQNLFGDKQPYLRGYGYQGSASREDWGRAVAELGIGGDFKDEMAQPGDWRIGGTAFGEMLPDHSNKISIDETKTDKWGLPVLKIDCEIKENEKLMRKDMTVQMAEMLESSGVKDVKTYDGGYAPGMGIHEMGTARMGRDPKTSVLNANNQVWDAPNVFVTDGSAMTSAAAVNPSLTYMALTARAADFAVNALKRHEL